MMNTYFPQELKLEGINKTTMTTQKMTIELVDNGFIVHDNTKTIERRLVFSNISQLLSHIQHGFDYSAQHNPTPDTIRRVAKTPDESSFSEEDGFVGAYKTK